MSAFADPTTTSGGCACRFSVIEGEELVENLTKSEGNLTVLGPYVCSNV